MISRVDKRIMNERILNHPVYICFVFYLSNMYLTNSLKWLISFEIYIRLLPIYQYKFLLT